MLVVFAENSECMLDIPFMDNDIDVVDKWLKLETAENALDGWEAACAGIVSQN